MLRRRYRGAVRSFRLFPSPSPCLRSGKRGHPIQAWLQWHGGPNRAYSIFQKRRRPSNVAAALLLPPPSPAPIGIFFLRTMDAPSVCAEVAARNAAAFQIRFSSFGESGKFSQLSSSRSEGPELQLVAKAHGLKNRLNFVIAVCSPAQHGKAQVYFGK